MLFVPVCACAHGCTDNYQCISLIMSWKQISLCIQEIKKTKHVRVSNKLENVQLSVQYKLHTQQRNSL